MDGRYVKVNINEAAINNLRKSGKRIVIAKPKRFIAFIGLAAVVLTALFLPKTIWRQVGGAINMQLDKGTYGILKEEASSATFKEEDAIKHYLQYHFPQIDGTKYAEQHGWFETAVLIAEMTDGAIEVETNAGPEVTKKYYIEKDQAKIDEYNKAHPEFIVLPSAKTMDLSNIEPEPYYLDGNSKENSRSK